jgi:prepilin-type N-terminal cleavage/methylation domain-containing protein
MHVQRRWRPGMSIIEILVVVSIIALLIAILLPTMAMIRTRAKVRSTKAMIESLSTALQQYLTDFDDYPPSTIAKLSGPAPEADSLYKYLCGANNLGVTANGKHYGPYLPAVPQENLVIKGGQTFIVDAWKNEIVYLNCRAHMFALKAAGAKDDGLTHNKTSFDLYSVGADGKKDPLNNDKDDNGDNAVDDASELVDDITNW